MKKVVLYQKIRDDLKQKIIDGKFVNGKLPPLTALVDEYKASLMTVNRAVKELESEGIVICGSGRNGTIINLPGLHQTNVESNANRYGDFGRQRTVTLRMLVKSSQLPTELYEQIVEQFIRRYPWIKIEQDRCNSLETIDYSSHDIIICRHVDSLAPERRGDFLPLERYNQVFPMIGAFNADERYSSCILWNTPLIFSDIKELPDSWSDMFSLMHKLYNSGKIAASMIGLYSLSKYFGDDLTSLFDMLNLFASFNTRWNNCRSNDVCKAFYEDPNMALLFTFSNMIKSDRPANLPPSVTGKYLAASVRCAVNSRSRYPKDALFFLNFLRSDTVQKMIVDHGVGFPYSRRIFSGYFAEKSPKMYNVVKNSVLDMIETDITEEMQSALYRQVYCLINNCIDGNLNRKEAIVLFKEYFNEIIKMDGVL